MAVADRSNFRMAAEHLCISQPALSRRINKLESALGLRLLEFLDAEQPVQPQQQALDEEREALSLGVGPSRLLISTTLPS